MSDFVQNAAFHDELAPRYDAHLTKDIYSVLARKAFVELVSRYVAPESTLLDFGCGTGLDAFQYARNGHRVLAYDNSPGMIAQLEHRCKGEIASGKITAWSEGYVSFLTRPQRWAPACAALADFAVLNSIRELKPLFDTFAHHLSTPGWIFISILNPLHWLRLRSPRWWLKGLLQGNGSPVFATYPHATYMHFVPTLLRAASQFRFVGRANSGRFVRYDPAPQENTPRWWWGHIDSNRRRMERVLWETPAYRMLGQFVFLVLRRDP